MKVLRKGDRGEEVKRLQTLLHVYADSIFGNMTDEALRTFQRENGLFPDGIAGPKTWAALDPQQGYTLKKSRRLINEIIVHCTATREGQDMTVEQIRAGHKAQGWSDIGYHYVIYRDGSIHNGRDVDIAGAHVSGRNPHSIGVVYVGGLENAPGVPYDKLKPKDTRTRAQKDALLKLLRELRRLYPSAKILGHRDCSKDKNGNGIVEPSEWVKACPSFDAKSEYKSL